MTDTLLVEGIQLPTDPPVPETEPSGPQEPPQAPPAAPPGEGGGDPEPEQPAAPAPILETAFVVYMNPQGHWMVAADIHSAAEMQISRPPNVDDFFCGASTVLRDIAVQETAATAVAMQQQALTQMAEQARQAQATAAINQALGGQAGGAGAIDLSTLGRGRP